MTDTNWRGPTNSLGAMEDGTVSPTDGPNYAYQGTVFPVLRVVVDLDNPMTGLDFVIAKASELDWYTRPAEVAR